MKKVIGLLLVVFMVSFSLAFVQSATAKDLKASLPLLPPLVENADKGILVDLVKAIDEAYPDGSIVIGVYPFKRSMQNVTSGAADFHMPILFNPDVPEDKLDFQHSTETLFKVVFVLYTNKGNKEINPKNVDKFKIETDRAHVGYFNFPIQPSDSIEGSLKKVDMGRIDGFIFAMPETDAALNKLGLKNINRWEYKTFEVKAVLPKGEKGKEIDEILTTSIEKLKQNGKYNQIMGPILDQKFQQ
jgi:polar amino acid transport system substrate-binding protein